MIRQIKKTMSLYYGHPPYGKTIEEHRIYMKWWRNLNRDDYNKKRLEWANKHRERRTRQSRDSYLKKKFNISFEQQEELLKKQNHKCVICLLPFKKRVDKLGRIIPTFCIDHNHKTGKVRGLICMDCNIGLGHFKDSIIFLERAINYLKIHRRQINSSRRIKENIK